MEVVIDVNVWVSALLWGGVPGYEKTVEGYVSVELLQELDATLRRAKFQPRLGKTSADGGRTDGHCNGALSIGSNRRR